VAEPNFPAVQPRPVPPQPPDPTVMNALRTACAVTKLKHVRALRVSGPGALDLLDAATTSRLFVRENQLLQTLLLDGAGRPFADAFVGLDDPLGVGLLQLVGLTRFELFAEVLELPAVRGERLAAELDQHGAAGRDQPALAADVEQPAIRSESVAGRVHRLRGLVVVELVTLAFGASFAAAGSKSCWTVSGSTPRLPGATPMS